MRKERPSSNGMTNGANEADVVTALKDAP